jgi:hypothetical protein
LKKNFRPEPRQRVEQRAISTDAKSVFEVQQMQRNAERISIGTFHIFGANPDTPIQTFTVAFTKEVSRSKLYSEFDKNFSGNWGPITKSELIHLSKPMPLKDIRAIIKKSYETALRGNR